LLSRLLKRTPSKPCAARRWRGVRQHDTHSPRAQGPTLSRENSTNCQVLESNPE
jgi:hypothetical protein